VISSKGLCRRESDRCISSWVPCCYCMLSSLLWIVLREWFRMRRARGGWGDQGGLTWSRYRRRTPTHWSTQRVVCCSELSLICDHRHRHQYSVFVILCYC
jgi:hypothetical protein